MVGLCIGRFVSGDCPGQGDVQVASAPEDRVVVAQPVRVGAVSAAGFALVLPEAFVWSPSEVVEPDSLAVDYLFQVTGCQ